MNRAIMAAYTDAENIDVPEPLPLRRVMPPGEPFPIDALGNVLAPAAKAILDLVQCPDAIGGQSVLGAASLAVQAHADIVLPATGAKPMSLYLVTVAKSGERKSGADSFALSPIRKREASLRSDGDLASPAYANAKAAYEKAREFALRGAKGDYAAGRAKLDAMGPAPHAPLVPMLTINEPTLAGMHKLFAIGHPSLGLFSDEGGNFLGGHGMNDDNRLQMAAGLSEAWDGSPIRRVRATDGASTLPGRRLATHLMVQPGIADRLLADPLMLQQGLLSRMLVAAPASIAGSRFQRPASVASRPALARYDSAMLAILEAVTPLRPGTQNELQPRALPLSRDALGMWSAFADWAERLLGTGGELEPVRAFANKLPEHACRIAGVLRLIDDLHAADIDAATMARGIALAQFYASEALRLFDAGSVPVAVQRAEALLRWLQGTWQQSTVGLSHIYQRGPNAIREASRAREAVTVLESHHWLHRIDGGATIDGKRHRDAWAIVPERPQ